MRPAKLLLPIAAAGLIWAGAASAAEY